ncbi:MAG: phosphoglycerol transferase MdoB-like AlkP superfamily enzyme, partial [Bermanella sp.]
GTGRSGAVKYTDFAIGEFLDNARKQAWFDNTIFVIVADHCASSAGKTDLPVERYHIPMWIYAPGIVQTKSVNTLASQIDIAPTLLGMLNMSYESWSFGKDILTMKADDERIMIGTYQKLGYLKQDELVILSPGKKVTKHELGNNESIINEPITEKNLDAASLKAIAYYQGADYIYKHGLNKWQPHATPLKLSQAQ